MLRVLLGLFVVTEACVGLAFRGGGSFGAVEAGLLSRVLEQQALENASVMTGISAGGLNVGFLASYMQAGSSLKDSVAALGSLYGSLTDQNVYSFNPFKSLQSWSWYQTSPLNTTIRSVLEPLHTITVAPKTLIGTSNLMTGMLEVVEYTELQSLSEKVTALMATSAIPFVFPPIAWNGSLYVDGGLISNEMIYQALEYLDCADPTLWYFAPSLSLSPIPKISGFLAFADRILNIISDGFDNQLQKLLVLPGNCKGSSINLQLCHPNTIGLSKLESYSILEFDYGSQLFEIGYETLECDTWQLCI
jgi:hypothetical protein